jgi:hypothetical protein
VPAMETIPAPRTITHCDGSGGMAVGERPVTWVLRLRDAHPGCTLIPAPPDPIAVVACCRGCQNNSIIVGAGIRSRPKGRLADGPVAQGRPVCLLPGSWGRPHSPTAAPSRLQLRPLRLARHTQACTPYPSLSPVEGRWFPPPQQCHRTTSTWLILVRGLASGGPVRRCQCFVSSKRLGPAPPRPP